MKALREQFRELGLHLLTAVAITMVVFTAALVLSRLEDVPPALLTRDALQVLGAQVYVGAISSLGILFWTMTATISLLTAYIARSSPALEGVAGFHLGFGLLTLWLTLDDLYLIHEKIGPYFTGLPQWVISGSYGSALILLVTRFWRVILHTPWLLLICSLACLGASAGMDALLEDLDRYVFVEDGFKFLGILCWALYFFRCAVQDLGRLRAPSPGTGAVSEA